MFQVERWLGPEGEKNRKKDASQLLDRLNARARERAARLRQGSESASPVVAEHENGAVSGALDQSANKVRESREEKKQKKRKKHQEGDLEATLILEPLIPEFTVKDVERKKDLPEEGSNLEALAVPISAEKERKRKKAKISSKSDLNSEAVSSHVDSSKDIGVTSVHPELVESEYPETQSKRQKKKKKKKKDTLQKQKGAQSSEAENGDMQLHDEGNISGEADLVAAGELKAEIDASDGQHEELQATDSAVLRSELDFSTIERDVDRIMGHDRNFAPPESQDNGPVLPWMRDPLNIDTYRAIPLELVPKLDTRLQAALKKTGIRTLFPVQMAVWHETVGPGLSERDVCVSSPTGSGKTLSYALPIVQKLSSRVVRLLRALVVLPTRDLASQVKAVFDTIAPSVGLAVGLAVGQTSVAAEAAELIQFRKKMVHSFGRTEESDHEQAESQVDILVATPGRLMDHIRNTRGFTLQHLIFLVVDETDRLLRQSYQDWLPNVLASVTTTDSRSYALKSSAVQIPYPSFLSTTRHCCLERGDRGTALPRLMKMVLSATLTRDPAKIAQLALYCPIYVAPSAIGNRYQLPEQLKSFRMVCKAGEKPLHLIALLQQLRGQPTIVFTASVVATHRLYTLLGCYKGLSFKVVEYSSLQHQQARSKALAKFRNGQAQVLIASDAMTRGMDVEGVANVVNYDMPVYAKTYVHRVGRTARAGQSGSCYTLLRKEEARHFKSMLKKVDNSKCKDYALPASATEDLFESYVEALEKLKKITADEAVSITHGNRMQANLEEKVSGPDELFM